MRKLFRIAISDKKIRDFRPDCMRSFKNLQTVVIRLFGVWFEVEYRRWIGGLVRGPVRPVGLRNAHSWASL